MDWLKSERPAKARHVYGLGSSLGAMTLVRAAAEDERIETVVLDSCFASASRLAHQHARRRAGAWSGSDRSGAGRLFHCTPEDQSGGWTPDRPLRRLPRDRCCSFTGVVIGSSRPEQHGRALRCGQRAEGQVARPRFAQQHPDRGFPRVPTSCLAVSAPEYGGTGDTNGRTVSSPDSGSAFWNRILWDSGPRRRATVSPTDGEV